MSVMEQIPFEDAGLLRFTTAGSVDDGKSTLIGRLLFDSKAIFEDQLNAVERTTKGRGQSGIDLSLLTDGLIAEREQGITIDVAYRYFATPARKFIIADTPGHEQYTRNMVTGASTADLAIVLVDARHGLITQSRRHAFIASLLRIPHLVVAVNKMDLVDYRREPFDAIQTQFLEFSRDLDFARVDVLPISALNGEMVVDRGEALSWYDGPTLLQILETAKPWQSTAAGEFYFPVQWVARPGDSGHPSARGYSGRIESGRVRRGDAISILPTGRQSRVQAIRTFDGELEEAIAPQSVTLILDDQIDISRGDALVSEGTAVESKREIEATLCWLSEEPMSRGRRYLIKHGARVVKALVGAPAYRVNVNTLAQEPADTLHLNDIGRVTLKVAQPLACMAYRDNRVAGSFIVIDEATHNTVAAGLVA
jgi:sulfate adenylyltransferase subunit 1